MKFNSLTLRLAAAAVLWSVVLLIVGGMLLASLFGAYVERNFDARLKTYLNQMAATALVGESGELSKPLLTDPRFDEIFSGWYWQIGHGATLLHRSPSLWDHVLEPPADASSVTNDVPIPGPVEQDLRYITAHITPEGLAAPLSFTIAVDRLEVAEELSQFNSALIWSLRILGPWLLGLILLGFVLFVLFQQRFGMRPVRDLGKALNDIRAGRADRIEGNYPVELDPLARELNALLDHNSAIIERARAHAGDLAHMIKTPLTVLLNEADQAEGPLAEMVKRHAENMRHQVDHQLSRARMAATANLIGARAPVGPAADDLTRALGKIYSNRGITIVKSGDLDAHFRGEFEDLEEMIGNLMENACKWATSHVGLNIAANNGRLVITVDDDGPGLNEEECVEVLKRGKRLDESVPGTGLGLAIVVDIAGLYGGDIELGPSDRGGLRATLELPAAE
ncbi:MAG: HAMP domain-containing sensor histidine kinase [Alphaproteobacteria bacterium]|nr:HAMP domain-containing sensor histidine kinase [Alphaproteobacteria bacterium]